MTYKFKSKFLDRLGVRSWINARNWTSAIGSSWIDERVLEAMNEVSATFVDMHELYRKADEGIAALCQVQDAHVTPGAGAAITLAVAGRQWYDARTGLWRSSHRGGAPSQLPP